MIYNPLGFVLGVEGCYRKASMYVPMARRHRIDYNGPQF